MYTLTFYDRAGRHEVRIEDETEAISRYNLLVKLALPVTIYPEPLLRRVQELTEGHILRLAQEDDEWVGRLDWDGSRVTTFEAGEIEGLDLTVEVCYLVKDEDFRELDVLRLVSTDSEGVRHVHVG